MTGSVICATLSPMIESKKLNNGEGENEEEHSKEPRESGALAAKMLKTRTVLLSGEVNKGKSERVIRQLVLLENMGDQRHDLNKAAAGDEPIKLFIDSPGGDADAGFAIFDMLRFIKPKVFCVGMGLVASAAAIILLSAPKERRFGLPNSHYLIHQPLSGIRGVATDIEIHARELEKLRKKINVLISGETGKEFAQVEKDTDRDFWMNAAEAQDYGLLSSVIESHTALPDK